MTRYWKKSRSQRKVSFLLSGKMFLRRIITERSFRRRIVLRRAVMEQEEIICVKQLNEIQVAPQQAVIAAEEPLTQDNYTIVIHTENYLIEIEIY
jgi:hypothetical protein